MQRSAKTKVNFWILFSWATPRVLLSVFSVVIALQLAVLCVRIVSIWEQGELAGTTGLEGVVVYPIWKVIHGYPLYEWPYRFPFTSTPYNFLFFEAYAWPFRLLHLAGSEVLSYGKFMTFAFSLAGAFVQYCLCRTLAPDLRNGFSRSVFALGALLTWFGTAFASWWALTVRPDAGATMLTLLGLLIAIRAIDNNRPAKMMLASVFLFAGWAFKQTFISYVVGLGFYLLWKRRWSDFACLVLPYAVLSSATLIIGGKVYLYNIIQFDLDLDLVEFPEVMRLLSTGLQANVFFWAIGILGLALFQASSMASIRAKLSLSSQAVDLIRHKELIVLALLASIALAVTAFAFPGSSRNHLFQAHVMVGVLLSLVIAVGCSASRESIMRGALAASIVSLILIGVLPALQLLHLNRYGLQFRYSDDVFDARRQFVGYLKTSEKPIYVDNDIFSLPWFVTGNRYPAFPLDDLYYDKASQKGLIEDGGVQGLIAHHCFAIVLLPAGDPWVPVAIDADYRQESLEPLWSKALEAKEPWVRLLRSRSADSSCPVLSAPNSR